MAGKRNQKSDIPASGVGWITKLAEQVNVPFPPPGEGWLTLGEVSKLLNRGLTATTGALRRANAETKRFSHIGSDGRRVVLVHYRIK